MSKLDDILTGFPFQGGGTKVWEYNDYGQLVKPQIKDLITELLGKDESLAPVSLLNRSEQTRVRTENEWRKARNRLRDELRRKIEAL